MVLESEIRCLLFWGGGGGEVNVALLWSEFVGSSEETELFFPSHLLTTKKERTAITNQSSYETNTLEKRRPETLSYRKLGITLIITFLKAHVFVRSNSVTILFHLIYIWFLFIYSISCKVCKKTTKMFIRELGVFPLLLTLELTTHTKCRLKLISSLVKTKIREKK